MAEDVSGEGGAQGKVSPEALAAAFRALSGGRNVEVRCRPSVSGASARLSADEQSLTVGVPQPQTEALTGALRGAVDAEALRLRYHDAAIHADLRAGGGGELLDQLEGMRVWALGAQAYHGVAQNLDQHIAQYFLTRGLTEKAAAKQLSINEAAAWVVYQALSQRPLPPAAGEVLALWEKIIGKKVVGYIEQLVAQQEDQAAFAAIVNQMVNRLGGAGAGAEATQQQPKDATGHGGEEQAEERPSAGMTALPPSASEDKTEKGEDVSVEVQDRTTHGDAESEAEQPAEKRRESNVASHPAAFSYGVYTTQYDMITGAETLAERGELAELRASLDEKLASISDITSRLANRLQRTLQALYLRSWKFHMEEGALDVAKLTHIITDPTYPYLYKEEKEVEHPNTVVSLLIDNSGSMRGRPILMAAMSADILARTLERCGIRVEILGFTTRDWKGGQSRQLWTTQGQPPQPGRLNDILHIVYKAADAPWRRTRKHLGLMLKDGILKENIDGEALLWAYDRLQARTEQRKILMVISDGAPVDDSTLSSNQGDYLDMHLRQVIAEIESEQQVELLAIGIGHDVTGYYQHAVTLRDAAQLGDTMVQELAGLFSG